MNPKITISIDTKNKAIATLTGMVTVGSKVDIEISGLPDSIPNWREIDPYTGKSLRFRVVDCLGNDLVRYPLVKKGDETNGDTWDVGYDGVYANSDGCEVDFNTHKLRHTFNQVPFNEYMELGIILDSFVDSAEYAIGKIKIRQWSSASCDTPTVLPDWREILHGLKTDLESVNQSKAAAAASATQSATSATNAATSAYSASASESSAADYAAAANEAKEDAVEAMLKYPYIDEFGHWRVWSVVAGEWVDHGDVGAHYDDEVTETSANGVKSSGIWTWVKSLLPSWLTSDYTEPATVASVSAEEQRAKAIELDLRRRVENLGSSKADKTTTYTKSETDAKITANVENSVTSTSTTKALSANMGKELQDQIQNLKQRGRYLSIWDCTTGLAKTEPTVNPYEYKAGDYFIVGTVGTTNYRPSGTSYDKTVPSTTVETGSPIVNDTYYYDGTSWTLLHTEQSEISWDSVVSKPDTFPPSAHTHTKSEITDFPTSMPPTAHSHASDSWFTSALSDKLDKTAVVAPSESATAGQAADAAKVGEALAMKAPSNITTESNDKIRIVDGDNVWWIVASGIYYWNDGEAGEHAHTPTAVFALPTSVYSSSLALISDIDARLPYPLYAVPSNGLLKDRAINTTSLASVTVPDDFTDLLIRASVASSLAVTMPDAITTKYGDTFPAAAGEYLVTITKTGAAEAYVRVIKLEVANA